MPIIAAFFADLAALIYAGYQIYSIVSHRFGSTWGYTAVVLAIVVLIYLVYAWFQRYQRIHGKSINKHRVLHQKLATEQKL